jgi:hypothetical protein
VSAPISFIQENGVKLSAAGCVDFIVGTKVLSVVVALIRLTNAVESDTYQLCNVSPVEGIAVPFNVNDPDSTVSPTCFISNPPPRLYWVKAELLYPITVSAA